MRRMIRAAAWAVALGLAPAVVADTPKQGAPPSTAAGRATGQAVDRAAEIGSDAWITATVKTKIMSDADAKRGVIHVDVKDHVVTLTGSVPSLAARDRALSIAGETSGVNQVVDRLALVPTP